VTAQLLLIVAIFSAIASSLSFEAQFRRIAATVNRSELYEFFREMPKGGILHIHSEYAVPPVFWLQAAIAESRQSANEYYARTQEESCPAETAKPILFVTIRRSAWERLSACEKQSFKPLSLLSSEERISWMEALTVSSGAGARHKFFQDIVARLEELCTDPEIMLQVVPEVMREAQSEHVEYLELQFDPTSMRDAAGNGVSAEAFVKTLKGRLQEPAVADTGVLVRFQIAAYRFASDPDNELANAFKFVNDHRDLWVGVNFLGEEGRPGGELSRFASAFQKMRAQYDIPLSLHAGELDLPGHEVRDALFLGASRIGHAVNLITDPVTMLLMRHADIPIETSLVSNKLLNYTPDLATHPFPLYLRSGIPMCLNTDDPGAFGGTLSDEFFLAETVYHLSWNEIVGLARNSIQYAFLDGEAKADLMARLDHNLTRFEARMSAANWRHALDGSHTQSGFAKRYLQLGM
jgi:adenosine deaminase CECR1